MKPDYAEAHNTLGVAFFKLKRYKEAERAFTEAVRLKPNFSLARYNLGAMSLVMNRREAALEQYNALKTLSTELATKLYGGIYRGMVLSLSDR